MKRRHLFEFEDLSWFPAVLRNPITDLLREAIVLRGDVYAPVVPLLAKLVREHDVSRIVDLCSGGSGPWTVLKGRLAEEDADVELVLTDKYPNREALAAAVRTVGDGRTRYEAQSVDATAVPERLSGLRTLFTGFHHLRPHTARRVLADAYRRREAIAVFEFTERRWAPILLTVPLGPLLVWGWAARLRPVSYSRLFFSYLVPLVPLAFTWDGIASNLRTYTTEELREMVHDLDAPDYSWETGVLKPEGRGGPPVTYLIGRPVGIEGGKAAAR
ncbi:hypothetical protein ABT247_16505 [Kitasatospora sp. NPDC001539]|uniref:hypothetical protein n=1 Tax=Kitasatospora sp. NPDC001539 TaxID=3154384 RepID=UPI00332C1ED8